MRRQFPILLIDYKAFDTCQIFPRRSLRMILIVGSLKSTQQLTVRDGITLLLCTKTDDCIYRVRMTAREGGPAVFQRNKHGPGAQNFHVLQCTPDIVATFKVAIQI